jgi:hypothetical protein
VTGITTQQIRRKPVLGGLINEYTRVAWRRNLQVTCPIVFSSGTAADDGF